MVRILPYIEYEIHSEKSPNEIHTILKSVTDLRKFAFFPEGEFVGQVYPMGFKIVPKPPYFVRNSFLPVIRGRVWEGGNGTAILMKMGLNLFVRIFLLVFFGMHAFCLMLGLFSILIGKGSAGATIFLFSLVSILFLQLLMRRSFHTSAKKAVERLEELFH